MEKGGRGSDSNNASSSSASSDRNAAAALAVAAAAAGLPAGLDPATAALYANMLSGSSAGGSSSSNSSNSAASGAAAAQGYAAMAAAAAAAQQQHQQAAALVALGQGAGGGAAAAAAWYNLANLQQMEMVARLQQQAGAGGAPQFLHPHHLLGLEVLHQQQAMMAAQLAQHGSSKSGAGGGSSSNRSSKHSSSRQGGGSNSSSNSTGGSSRASSSNVPSSSSNSLSTSRDYLYGDRGASSGSSRDYRSEYAALAREYAAVSTSSPSRRQQDLELSRLMAAAAAAGGGTQQQQHAAAARAAAAAAYFGSGGLDATPCSSSSGRAVSSASSLPYGIAHIMGDSAPSTTTTAPSKHSSLAASSSSSSSSNSSSSRDAAASALLLQQQQQQLLAAAAAASNPATLAYHHQHQQQLQHLQHLQQLHHLQQLQKSAALGSSRQHKSEQRSSSSSHYSQSGTSTTTSSSRSAPSSSISKAMRNKELEIIPISPHVTPQQPVSSSSSATAVNTSTSSSVGNPLGGGANALGGGTNALGGGANALGGGTNTLGGGANALGGGANALGGGASHLLGGTNTLGGGASSATIQALLGGAASSSHLADLPESLLSARLLLEAAGLDADSAGGGARASGGRDDGPLNLSLKAGLAAAAAQRDKRDRSLDAALRNASLLQSLAGHHGSPDGRDVIASMQEALQRQLFAADEKKREEKKKRMEEAQERSRALGRGSCKPKKNTVASLLEHCRAAGIKPTLPLPPSLQSSLTGGGGGLGALAGSLSSPSSAAAALACLGSSLSISEARRPSAASPSSATSASAGLTSTPSSVAAASVASCVSSAHHLAGLASLAAGNSTSSSSYSSVHPLSSLTALTGMATSHDGLSTVSTSATQSLPASLLPHALPHGLTATPLASRNNNSSNNNNNNSNNSGNSSSNNSSRSQTPSSTTSPSVLSITALVGKPTSSTPTTLTVAPSLSITSLCDPPAAHLGPPAAHLGPPSDSDRPIVSILPASALLERAHEGEQDGNTSQKRHPVVTSTSTDGRLLTTIRLTTSDTTTTTATTTVGSEAHPTTTTVTTADMEASLAMLMATARRGFDKRSADDGGHHPQKVASSVDNSDSEDSDLSSMDDDGHALAPHHWATDRGVSSSPPAKRRRKMVTDESQLRVPLQLGWRRETSIRCISNSGVRGEVVYYAPCGKTVRQYPDIIRYLERNNMTEVTRDHFSFSSKLVVGEYYDTNTGLRFSESQIHAAIREVRGAGYSRHHNNSTTSTSNSTMKEQDRIKRLDEYKKEKEELRKQKEECSRLRLYDQLRKAQEREQEKTKQKFIKEQDRERRRYHGVLVRCLEARKKFEDREKRREEIREEKRVSKERKRCEREAARELNLLLKEVHEDMELTDHAPLPPLPRLPHLALPPLAAANLLMLSEFLCNFGAVLGFDMDTLPSVGALQQCCVGCSDNTTDDDLVSVVCHLLVCAIEDPGVPSRHTTLLGHTLPRADVTPTTLSEILRVYLTAVAHAEVRVLCGAGAGTDRERRDMPDKAEEYNARLADHTAYRMAEWLSKVPFSALTATQKLEVVAQIINDLLQNRAVVRQIEASLDKHNSLKTDKWKLDAKIRKLRMSIARKRIYHSAAPDQKLHNDDSNLSVCSSVGGGGGAPTEGGGGKKGGAAPKDSAAHDDEEEELDEGEESGGDSDVGIDDLHDTEDLEGGRSSAKEVAALQLLQQEMDGVRQELFDTAQQVRAVVCGQDRYQRTMWMLPHCGGPYLEGISSCDYLPHQHFPTPVPVPVDKTDRLPHLSSPKADESDLGPLDLLTSRSRPDNVEDSRSLDGTDHMQEDGDCELEQVPKGNRDVKSIPLRGGTGLEKMEVEEGVQVLPISGVKQGLPIPPDGKQVLPIPDVKQGQPILDVKHSQPIPPDIKQSLPILDGKQSQSIPDVKEGQSILDVKHSQPIPDVKQSLPILDVKHSQLSGDVKQSQHDVKSDDAATLKCDVKQEDDVKDGKLTCKTELLANIDDIPLPDIPPRIASAIHSLSKLEPMDVKPPEGFLPSRADSSTPRPSPCKDAPSEPNTPVKLEKSEPITNGVVETAGPDSANESEPPCDPSCSTTPTTCSATPTTTCSTTPTTSVSCPTTVAVVGRELVATGLGLIPGQYLRPEHVMQAEHLSFSLLPRALCCPQQHYSPHDGEDDRYASSYCKSTPTKSPRGDVDIDSVREKSDSSEKSVENDDLSAMDCSDCPPVSSTECCLGGVTTPTNTLTTTLTTTTAGGGSVGSTAPTSPSTASTTVVVLSQKELLERLHQTAEAAPIPAAFLSGWWRVRSLEELKEFQGALNDRGLRERELKRFLEKHCNIIKHCSQQVDLELTSFVPVSANHVRHGESSQPRVASMANGRKDDSDWPCVTRAPPTSKGADKAVQSKSGASKAASNWKTVFDKTPPTICYDKFGNAEEDVASDWSASAALKDEMFALEYILALEEKITAASMQNKSWSAAEVPPKNPGSFAPAFLANKLNDYSPASDDQDMETVPPSPGSAKPHEGARDAPNMEGDAPRVLNAVHLGRERLLKLEEGIERRYLKPPLAPGHNVKANSSGGAAPGTEPPPVSSASAPTAHPQQTSPTNGDAPSAGAAVNGADEDGDTKAITDVYRGLTVWRRAVGGCETAAQLHICAQALENAVAWDKSIMKAFCQFCSSGDFEEKLLLCDGCDKGYHTHCFRPPMVDIPDGDWFCYECVNKELTGTQGRHCLVCGGTDGRNLLHCATCARSFHATPCANPPVVKIPRSKWHCPACSNKTTRSRRAPRSKKSNPAPSAAQAPPTTSPAPPSNSMTPPTQAPAVQSAPFTAVVATPTHGAAPPSNFTAPPTHGAAPPSNFTAPPTHGAAPPSNFTAPPTHAAAPPTNFTAPPTHGATPPTPGAAPPINFTALNSDQTQASDAAIGPCYEVAPSNFDAAETTNISEAPEPGDVANNFQGRLNSTSPALNNSFSFSFTAYQDGKAAGDGAPDVLNSDPPALEKHNSVASNAVDAYDETSGEDKELDNNSSSNNNIGDSNNSNNVEHNSPDADEAHSVAKKNRPAKKVREQVQLCRVLLSLLEEHADSWPFLRPVNTRQFPAYRRVIRRPIDLSVVRRKLEDGSYKTPLEFSEDLQLMFNNCETFNEDDSPVGKAGHSLRAFCNLKWADLFPSV